MGANDRVGAEIMAIQHLRSRMFFPLCPSSVPSVSSVVKGLLCF